MRHQERNLPCVLLTLSTREYLRSTRGILTLQWLCRHPMLYSLSGQNCDYFCIEKFNAKDRYMTTSQ